MILTDFEIRTALCWDRFRESELTAIERILIHQWMGQRFEPPVTLRLKVEKIYSFIPNNWQSPNFKYNEDRVLTYEDPETFHYKIVKS